MAPLIEKPISLDPEYDEKLASFKVECNNGSLVACHSLAEFASVVEQDFEKAAGLYIRGCYAENNGVGSGGGRNNGALPKDDAKISNQLGFSNGQGVVKGKHNGKAIAEYPPSCFNLGRMLLSGKGVTEDVTKSKECFERACDIGNHYPSCHHLAIMLLDGVDKVKSEIVAKNYIKPEPLRAKKLLERGCYEGEDPATCYLLGGILLNGKSGIKKDSVAAELAFLESCNRGSHGPSCFNLAVMYKNGDGLVKKDEKKFTAYKELTEKLVAQNMGSLSGRKIG